MNAENLYEMFPDREIVRDVLQSVNQDAQRAFTILLELGLSSEEHQQTEEEDDFDIERDGRFTGDLLSLASNVELDYEDSDLLFQRNGEEEEEGGGGEAEEEEGSSDWVDVEEKDYDYPDGVADVSDETTYLEGFDDSTPSQDTQDVEVKKVTFDEESDIKERDASSDSEEDKRVISEEKGTDKNDVGEMQEVAPKRTPAMMMWSALRRPATTTPTPTTTTTATTTNTPDFSTTTSTTTTAATTLLNTTTTTITATTTTTVPTATTSLVQTTTTSATATMSELEPEGFLAIHISPKEPQAKPLTIREQRKLARQQKP